MTRYPILIAVCGRPPDSIARDHGDFVQWFGRSLGERVQVVPWDLGGGEDMPDLGNFAGVLVTGSPASLTEPEPWMELGVEAIRQASERSIPLLGVCFGHQLVGCAFGAPCLPAEGGGEQGSHPMRVTEAGKDDPLLRHLPAVFDAPCMHYDQVDPGAIASRNGLTTLAESDNTRVQALAAGPWVRSVQFHPEFTQEVMAAYLRDKGIDSEARPCSEVPTIFSNWIDHWVARRPSTNPPRKHDSPWR